MKRIVVGLGAGFALVLWITQFDGGISTLMAAILGGIVGALAQSTFTPEFLLVESHE